MGATNIQDAKRKHRDEAKEKFTLTGLNSSHPVITRN
jgi:hypothetical protein